MPELLHFGTGQTRIGITRRRLQPPPLTGVAEAMADRANGRDDNRRGAMVVIARQLQEEEEAIIDCNLRSDLAKAIAQLICIRASERFWRFFAMMSNTVDAMHNPAARISCCLFDMDGLLLDTETRCMTLISRTAPHAG